MWQTNAGGGGSSSWKAKIWVGSHPADHLQLIPALGEGKVLGKVLGKEEGHAQGRENLQGWRFNISPSTGCLCHRNGSWQGAEEHCSVQENRRASQKELMIPKYRYQMKSGGVESQHHRFLTGPGDRISCAQVCLQ